MKVHLEMVAVLLLVLLCSVLAPSEALGIWAATPKLQPEAGDGGDSLPRQGLGGSHPLAGPGGVMGEVPPSSRPLAKAMAKALLGSGKQDPPSKPWRIPQQPSRSRSLGLSHHLKGHGKFNGDTHSCHSIQSRPCQKPSDCGGCLGLYTCKLPAGTCNLKGVSRQRAMAKEEDATVGNWKHELQYDTQSSTGPTAPPL